MTEPQVNETLASRLNYAQCWEDERVLRAALQVGPGDRVLSIASAGDNSIALALDGADVVAVDLSRAQLAVCELKLAGRHLSWSRTRQLLGVDRGEDPQQIYLSVRDSLSPASRAWWDSNPEVLQQGVLNAGRFERYLGMFRDRMLPLIHRRRTVAGWFDLTSLAEQERYYTDVWDRRRWRGLFRLFFSQRVMAARGRSPEQFAHVDGPVSEAFLQRTRHVLTELPLQDNGYAQWLLMGRWLHESALPPYLTQEGHAQLGAVAERITLVHGGINAAVASQAAGRFNAFNLSDIFEYLTPEQTEVLYGELLDAAAPGARLAYWNLLVPRSCPPRFSERVRCHEERAAQLLFEDRAFFYGGFHLEEVL